MQDRKKRREQLVQEFAEVRAKLARLEAIEGGKPAQRRS